MMDHLSSVLDGTDPLSLFAATADPMLTESTRKKCDKEESLSVGSDFEPWSSKRGDILSRYTTNEKLSINLYMGSEKGKATTPGSAVSEKVRTRLEELEDLEECSKLLSDTTVIQFYPICLDNRHPGHIWKAGV
ncbi:VPS35 endosomal protein-sorting factor-like isoform X2 [Anolis sagrei]|uniref:VPS35 endosomal protein-sorting factor-like isoform X2 n=1 Tax=Anolis sagrei TaxID=38937 RepID=UPI0035222D77